jgi:hypothetical protein
VLRSRAAPHSFREEKSNDNYACVVSVVEARQWFARCVAGGETCTHLTYRRTRLISDAPNQNRTVVPRVVALSVPISRSPDLPVKKSESLRGWRNGDV